MPDISIGFIGGNVAYRLMSENKITGRRLGPRPTPCVNYRANVYTLRDIGEDWREWVAR